MSNSKLIFWEIWSEKVKAICFDSKLAQAHTYIEYLEDADSYSEISFLNFQTNIHFMGKFESKKLNSQTCLEAGTQSVLRM